MQFALATWETLIVYQAVSFVRFLRPEPHALVRENFFPLQLQPLPLASNECVLEFSAQMMLFAAVKPS